MSTKAKVIPVGYNDVSLRWRIADIAQDSNRVLLRPHARTRMRERGVTLVQVLRVLQKGSVWESAHQDIKGKWKCTLRHVVAGDDLKVSCALDQLPNGEMVVVITVFR